MKRSVALPSVTPANRSRHASEGWHLIMARGTATTLGGWVYIMTNRFGGMLYIGVTAHLAARVYQHRCDTGSAFCRRYGLKMLVYAERHEDIVSAIEREKAIKAWKRAWKIRLIETTNPDWCDLYDTIA